MRTVVLAVLLCLVAGVPCMSGTVPSLTWEINVIGDVKEYTYTLTNDLDSKGHLIAFGILIPDYGRRNVTKIWCTRTDGGWHTSGGMGSNFYEEICATRLSYLLPGESVSMKLTTGADVPTAYDYAPLDWTSNWRWSVSGIPTQLGNTCVPVPVPEPSSLLVLAGGIGAIGWPSRRRSDR